MKNEALKRAVAKFPTLKAFAETLSTPERPVTYQMVQQWAELVPPEYCPDIERISGRAAMCEELNDRVDWAYVRASARDKRRAERRHEERRTSTT